VAAVNEMDEIIARVRAHGPVSLPLHGWDRASTWGWDEATGSLYAHLWRNTDDPSQPPAVQIEPGGYTPAITLLPTLAQYIAMGAGCDAWKALTALFKVEDEHEYRTSTDRNARAGEASTVVTMTQGYDIWWPPDHGEQRKRPA
jgi:hypothetical protein